MLSLRRNVLAFGLVASAGLGYAERVAFQVKIPGMSFSPKKITIVKGDTIVWENTSAGTHTVTANKALARKPENVLLPEGANEFDSGAIKSKDKFEMDFTVVGNYRYFCRPHELMGHLGEIEVVEAVDTTLAVTDIIDDVWTNITVPADAVVEWKNTSNARMTVIADQKLVEPSGVVTLPEGAEAFSSTTIAPEGLYLKRLKTPGDYFYYVQVGTKLIATKIEVTAKVPQK